MPRPPPKKVVTPPESDEDQDFQEDSQEDEDYGDGDEEVEEPEGDDEEPEGEAHIPDLDDMVSVFVVGDTHFRKDNFIAQEELVEKCVEAAKNVSPSIIILLGDVLDTHETLKNAPWKQATRLIEELSKIAPVYVLVGNHDYINQTQFLTDDHFFNPLKKWPRVVIVDYPIIINLGGHTLVMCPYVPPGRFIEALDHVEGWRDAVCIYAHQEILGCEYGNEPSQKGDQWSDDLPTIISGHIHKPSRVGRNVFYPGSSIQVHSNEDPDKRVWLVTFDGDEEDTSIRDDGYGVLQFDKIDLGLKGKKEIEIPYEELRFFDFGLTDHYYIKLKISGTPEQFKLFRKSQLRAKMVRSGIRIGYNPTLEDNPIIMALTQGNADLEDELTFESILKELVKHKPLTVQRVYEEMYGVAKKEKRYIEIVTERIDDEAEDEDADAEEDE